MQPSIAPWELGMELLNCGMFKILTGYTQSSRLTRNFRGAREFLICNSERGADRLGGFAESEGQQDWEKGAHIRRRGHYECRKNPMAQPGMDVPQEGDVRPPLHCE